MQKAESVLAISRLVRKSNGNYSFVSGYNLSRFGIRDADSEARARAIKETKELVELSEQINRISNTIRSFRFYPRNTASRRLEIVNEERDTIKVVVEPWLCEFDVAEGEHLYLVDNREDRDHYGLHLVFRAPNYIVVHNFSRLLWPYLNGQLVESFCSRKESPFPMYDLLERWK